MTNTIPSGFQNIAPAQLSTLVPRPRVVDVREPAELTGELQNLMNLEGRMRAYDEAGLPVERR